MVGRPLLRGPKNWHGTMSAVDPQALASPGVVVLGGAAFAGVLANLSGDPAWQLIFALVAGVLCAFGSWLMWLAQQDEQLKKNRSMVTQRRFTCSRRVTRM